MRQPFSILVGVALLSAAHTTGAWGQEKFPTKPIELIIPTAAGGGTDIAFRRLAEIVEPILGQKVVIANKTGGGGAIGMAQIIQARPDGYTLGGLWNAPLTITPHMQAANYTPKDYTTVTLSTWAPGILCTKTAFPASDGKTLIEELRKNPDKYTYANDGVGGTMHLAFERIFAKLGAKARAVPFNGAAESLKAFLGNHVDLYTGSIAPIQPYIKDGSAKCLLVTSAERNESVPTAAGLDDFAIGQEATVLWRGIIAPNRIPSERLAVLEKAFAEAAQSDKFKQFMASRGEEARGTPGEPLRKLIDSEYAAMGQVMTVVGLKK